MPGALPTALEEKIVALIGAQGPISVAQYMAMALFDPQQGYYTSREPFGRRGDFVTSPDISQMFGELIGLWCAQAWLDLGSPRMRLIELGPGRGTLMADALRAAQVVPGFASAIEVAMIEASPSLQEAQKKHLGHARIPIAWHRHFDAALADRPVFVIANEFFDALPVRQFVHAPGGWRERMVTAQDGALSFALAPVALPAAAVPAHHHGAAEGTVFETAPAALALTEEIARAIANRGGAALFVDYGYEDGRAGGETLQAVAAHGFADVLQAPGAQDISAHVDFGALRDAASRGGARAHGPVTQGDFLTGMGIEARAETLARANPAQAGVVAGALHRLTHADAMGRLFKVLALSQNGAPPPPGFGS